MQAIFAVIASIAGVISTAVVFFTTWYGVVLAQFLRKMAVYTASVVAGVVLILALIAGFKTLLDSIADYMIPPSWVVPAINYLMPAHIVLYISVILTARVAKFVFHWAMVKLTWLNSGG
ncbi:MAG: hypothetical protein H7836_15390 [Magnetococcus sp. YQC-3]